MDNPELPKTEQSPGRTGETRTDLTRTDHTDPDEPSQAKIATDMSRQVG